MAATWTGCRFHALFFPYKTIEEHNTANCCLCLFCFFIFFTGHVITIFQLEMIQMYFFQSSKLQVVKNCWDDSPWAFLRERIGLVRAFLVGIHQFGHGAFESQYSLVIEHSCENSLFVIGKSSKIIYLCGSCSMSMRNRQKVKHRNFKAWLVWTVLNHTSMIHWTIFFKLRVVLHSFISYC